MTKITPGILRQKNKTLPAKELSRSAGHGSQMQALNPFANEIFLESRDQSRPCPPAPEIFLQVNMQGCGVVRANFSHIELALEGTPDKIKNQPQVFEP